MLTPKVEEASRPLHRITEDTFLIEAKDKMSAGVERPAKDPPRTPR